MLERARHRAARKRLANIAGLHEMDAADLTFPDAYFDAVVAMFVMTVVPDPKAVMSELERVCAPGGVVILLNHFRREGGLRGSVESALASHSQTIGWRPDFPVQTVLNQDGLELVDARAISPFKLFTLLQFDKRAA
jgi:phosphatidylethanolamine/phosphatidyl-N-methylethanolamine N-methyltransferase